SRSLIFYTSEVPEEIPHGLNWLAAGGTPVVVGDDATPPLPEALWRIQLGRVGWLGLALEPASRATDDGFYRGPLMLLAAVLDHQQAFLRIVGQQVRQQSRQLALPQCGADMIMGPPSQRRDGPLDMHLGMIIPRGPCGPVVDPAPRRGQRRMASSGRFLHQDHFTVRGPRCQQRCPCGHEGGLCLGFGLQVAMAPPQANPQGVPQLPHPFPAILATTTGLDAVPDQCGGPHTGVIAHGPGTLAHHLLELCALLGRESSRAPWTRRSLQPWQPGLGDHPHPTANGLLGPIEPLGHLRTALALPQEQHTVLALPQPHLRRAAKGGPHWLTRHGRSRHGQHIPVLLPERLTLLYQQGLKNRHYCVASR